MGATVAVRLSTAFARLDGPANAITDAMNGAVPWLWFPLAVPDPREPMPAGAHALYAIHAVALHRAAAAVGLRTSRRSALVVSVLGWLWFTGAWDRRALRGGSAPSSSGRAPSRAPTCAAR